MSTNNMFDKTMKVYLNNDGSIERVVDSSFFVANSSEVNILQLIVNSTMNVNKVNVSFKRADGNTITNRVMLYKGLDLENQELKIYEYKFVENDRILSVGGNLEISFKVEYIDENNRKVYATPIISSYVRKNIDTSPDIDTAEAVYQEIDQLTANLQASVNEANLKIDEAEIDILDLKGDIAGLETVDEDIYNKIETLEEKDNALSERITDEKQAIEEETDTKINQIKEELEEEIDTKFNQLDENKLNKIFNDVAIANNLADNDYFILNSADVLYRITFRAMKDIILQNISGGGENHYKGDFLSYEGLIDEVPVGQPGDYAFVNIGTEMIMYVWDADGADETYSGVWRETTSGKYVLTTTFANLQQQLLNGGFIVDTAKNYDNGNNTKTNIKNKFEQIESDMMDVVTNMINPLQTSVDSLEEDRITILDLGIITNLNFTITQSLWNTIVNSKNIKVKAKIIYGNATVELIAEKYNSLVLEDGAIRSIWFRSNLGNSAFYFININADLNVSIYSNSYAIANTLSLTLAELDKTQLEASISDGDFETVIEVDLKPAIQKVIDDNNVIYVFSYDGSFSNDDKAKIIELMKADEDYKIVIKYSNRLYTFYSINTNTTSQKKIGFITNYVSSDNYKLYQMAVFLTLNKNTEELTLSSSNITTISYATDAEMIAGTLDNKIVTPKKFKTRLDNVLAPINTELTSINSDLDLMNTRIDDLESGGGGGSSTREWQLVAEGEIEEENYEEGFASFGENVDFDIDNITEYYVYFYMENSYNDYGTKIAYISPIILNPRKNKNEDISASSGGVISVGNAATDPTSFAMCVKDWYNITNFYIANYDFVNYGPLNYKIYAR